MRTARSFLISALPVLLCLACGGGGDAASAFPDPAAPPGEDGAGGGATVPSFGGSGTPGGPTAAPPSPACAVASVEGENVPVELVLQYDRSGSMKDDGKWASCKAGVLDFFATSPAGVSASLSFFPQGNACDATAFVTPQVAMTPLPNTTTLKVALDTVKLGSGTPTRPALDGALRYADARQAASPGSKVVVVLVTDGAPNDCGSTETTVSQVAAASAAKVPTFVIGVGNVTTLDAIAKAGGTGGAVIIDAKNPSKTSVDLRDALGKIRNQLSCGLVIPPPPAGQTFDKAKVNVVHTRGSVKETYQYDPTCTKPGAWRYDDPANPTRIEICPATCAALKAPASTTSRVDIELGCETVGSIPK